MTVKELIAALTLYDDNYACDDDCEYGVKAWLEKE